MQDQEQEKGANKMKVKNKSCNIFELNPWQHLNHLFVVGAWNSAKNPDKHVFIFSLSASI